jgi:hypothetical protein
MHLAVSPERTVWDPTTSIRTLSKVPYSSDILSFWQFERRYRSFIDFWLWRGVTNIVPTSPTVQYFTVDWGCGGQTASQARLDLTSQWTPSTAVYFGHISRVLHAVASCSGVPKWGEGFGGSTPTRNSEVLPKLSRIPSSVEYTS